VSDEFFEPPPPPEEPEEEHEPPRKPWHGPPENMLGATVALDLVLAVGDEIGLTIPYLSVYPDGISFGLLLSGRRFDSISELDDEWMPFGRRERESDPAERLRFGVQYADGSKATNVRTPTFAGDDPPPAPSLWPVGGGGGGHDYRHRFWLWPLPPRGPLTFVLEWRAAGVALTRHTVDSGPIVAAAERAVTLWPEEAEQSVRLQDSQWFDLGVAELKETEGEEEE
jgi:hypothetical protein